jgi:hypothetical protein
MENFLTWMITRVKSVHYAVAEEPVEKRSLKLKELSPWSIAKECYRQMQMQNNFKQITEDGEHDFFIEFKDSSLTVSIHSHTIFEEKVGRDILDCYMLPVGFESEIILSEDNDDDIFFLSEQQKSCVVKYLEKLV